MYRVTLVTIGVLCCAASVHAQESRDRPQLISKTLPSYPPIAHRSGIEQWVRCTIQIAPDGQVSQATVSRPESGGIGDAVRRAVMTWRFTATGKPDSVESVFVFRLLPYEKPCFELLRSDSLYQLASPRYDTVRVWRRAPNSQSLMDH